MTPDPELTTLVFTARERQLLADALAYGMAGAPSDEAGELMALWQRVAPEEART